MITATVEIPTGSKMKYEINKAAGILVLDRVISIPYPANYGFINDTLWYDGDPLDVFIISSEPLQPLSIVKIVPYAIIKCNDNGEKDDKVLAVIEGDLSPFVTDEIYTFLQVYKKGFEVQKIEYTEETLKAIELGKGMYEDKLIAESMLGLRGY